MCVCVVVHTFPVSLKVSNTPQLTSDLANNKVYHSTAGHTPVIIKIEGKGSLVGLCYVRA